MSSFSQRKGLKPIKKIVQIESMDDDLRNRLWNGLDLCYFKTARLTLSLSEAPNLKRLLESLWNDYFKLPIDTIRFLTSSAIKDLKERYFALNWNEVYDLIEFIAKNDPLGIDGSSEFMEYCNQVLEKEFSPYRFVGNEITQITAKEEIDEIEEALRSPLEPVNLHLRTALEKLSDKKDPDYRNSIKESISAVETVCRMISGNPKASLGNALDEIERAGKLKLHTALKQGFDKLYGYTSAEDGIRHSMRDIPDLSFEDAKFMLVSCSAFINYLVAKSSRAGIDLMKETGRTSHKSTTKHKRT